MTTHPQIGAALRPGEELLWTGRPAQGFRISALDFVLFPVWGLVSLAFARLAFREMTKEDWPVVALLITIAVLPVLKPALELLRDRNRRRRTFYALTSQRAIVFEAGGSPALLFAALEGLDHMSYVSDRKGTGSIAFGPWMPEPSWSLRHLSSHGLWKRRLVPHFEQVADVREVYGRAQAIRSGRVADASGPASI